MANKNGYNPSLFETEDGTCYLCGTVTDTARHEVFHGPNRQNSKAHGMWLCLCPECHRKVHREDNGEYLFLKEAAQELWEYVRAFKTFDILESPRDARTRVRKEFMAIFGRNYL